MLQCVSIIGTLNNWERILISVTDRSNAYDGLASVRLGENFASLATTVVLICLGNVKLASHLICPPWPLNNWRQS